MDIDYSQGSNNPAVNIVRGKNDGTRHTQFQGYSYRKDKNALLKSGLWSQRCIETNCKGRIHHSPDFMTVIVKHEHSHDPDKNDCVVRRVIIM